MKEIVAYYTQPTTSGGLPVFAWFIIGGVIILAVAVIWWLLMGRRSHKL